jgi:hypothetical protein
MKAGKALRKALQCNKSAAEHKLHEDMLYLAYTITQ